MTHYKLERSANVDLEFDGDVIANESSFEDGKKRWTEVRIYTTESGKWVTEVKGCSLMKGETPRIQATACKTPASVLKSLRSWSSKRRSYYFSYIVLDALEAAANADPRLASVVKETV